MKKLLVVLLVLVAMLMVTGCQQEEPAPHVHDLKKIAKQESTCSEVGFEAYWICNGCEELFMDQGATKHIVDISEVVIDMKPHTWKGEDCTAIDHCKYCDAIKAPSHEKHEAKADDGDCTTAVPCKYCTTVMVPAEPSHIGGVATCVSKASCTTCGKQYGQINPDGHSFDNAIYVWADDFSSCIVAGSCSLCETAVYEEVDTYYFSGKAWAPFTTPAIGTVYKDLSNPNRLSAAEYNAALSYMIANGETNIEVIFPAMKNLSGPVYTAVRDTANWVLEGAKLPEDVPNAVDTIKEMINKLPL